MLLLSRLLCLAVGVLGLSLAASAVLDLEHTMFMAGGLIAALSAMMISREVER